MKSCMDCGKPIARERLEVLPDAETCVRCSRERKVTEADIPVDGADPRELYNSNTGDNTEVR